MPVQTIIKTRRDTAANWTSTDPILASGEVGLETDTTLIKYGDGTSAWTALPYSAVSQIKQLAKNDTGGSVTKGQVVYISGSNGANALFQLADADAEATSSKTVGFLAQDLATNGIGAIITEGLITGINTGAATAGDSVWLSGTPGGFVFGAPPAKPAHGVYLGVVTRASSTVGEILVKIQNGYELNELHDVNITGTIANNEVLAYDDASSMWINQTASEAGLLTPTSAVPTATNAAAASGFGFIGLPQVSTATGLSLTAAHAGKHIYTTVTGQTHTIPANASVPLEIGTTIVFINPASVTTNITITSDSLIIAGTGATTIPHTLAPYGMATAVKVGATSWVISGNGLT